MFTPEERERILARARDAQNGKKERQIVMIRAVHDPWTIARQLEERRTNPMIPQGRRYG